MESPIFDPIPQAFGKRILRICHAWISQIVHIGPDGVVLPTPHLTRYPGMRKIIWIVRDQHRTVPLADMKFIISHTQVQCIRNLVSDVGRRVQQVGFTRIQVFGKTLAWQVPDPLRGAVYKTCVARLVLVKTHIERKVLIYRKPSLRTPRIRPQALAVRSAFGSYNKIRHKVQIKSMVILRYFHQMLLEKLAVPPATRGILCPDFVPRVEMRPHKWLYSRMRCAIAI